jgi:hypothetical protein
MCYVTDLLELTKLSFYHSSVVKVLPIERAGFYQHHPGLSRLNSDVLVRDITADAFYYPDIGTPDQQTNRPGL